MVFLFSAISRGGGRVAVLECGCGTSCGQRNGDATRPGHHPDQTHVAQHAEEPVGTGLAVAAEELADAADAAAHLPAGCPDLRDRLGRQDIAWTANPAPRLRRRRWIVPIVVGKPDFGGAGSEFGLSRYRRRCREGGRCRRCYRPERRGDRQRQAGSQLEEKDHAQR
jgi:hypothetical protein